MDKSINSNKLIKIDNSTSTNKSIDNSINKSKNIIFSVVSHEVSPISYYITNDINSNNTLIYRSSKTYPLLEFSNDLRIELNKGTNDLFVTLNEIVNKHKKYDNFIISLSTDYNYLIDNYRLLVYDIYDLITKYPNKKFYVNITYLYYSFLADYAKDILNTAYNNALSFDEKTIRLCHQQIINKYVKEV